MEKLEEFVIEEVSKLIGEEADKSVLTKSLRDKGADSLDIFQVASDVEEKFNVVIRDKVDTGEDIIKLASIQIKK